MIEFLLHVKVVTLVLVTCRIGGFIAASPIPGQYATTKTKVGAVTVISLAVSTFATPPATVPALDLHLLPVAAVEVGIGLLVGLAFRIVLWAAAFLGDVAALSSGLGVPSAFNPDQGTQETVLTRVVTVFSLMLAVALGAHRVALAYLLESFNAVPLTSPVALAQSAPLYMDLIGDSFVVGVQLAAPIVAVSLAVQSVLALVARAAPTLQLFSIGFTVMVAGGLLTFVMAVRDIGGGLATHINRVGPFLERVFVAITS